MIGLCERFEHFMAETLHYAGAPDGLTVPLADAETRLVELAEKERSMPAGQPDISDMSSQNLERARFAVMAWADEQMLGSQRPDADEWAAVSLQFRYFKTAEAGRLFYGELEKCLDSCNVPRRARTRPVSENEEELAAGGTELSAGEAESAAEENEFDAWHDLSLAERCELAADTDIKGEEFETLKVFALCLLYGFCGELYDDPERLGRIRRACRSFFERTPEISAPHLAPAKRDALVTAEKVAFIVVPLLVCLLFALYCGGVLANAPFNGKF